MISSLMCKALCETAHDRLRRPQLEKEGEDGFHVACSMLMVGVVGRLLFNPIRPNTGAYLFDSDKELKHCPPK